MPPPAAPLPMPALVGWLARRELNECEPVLLWDASLPAGEETLRQVLSALSRPYVLARTPKSTAPSWLPQPPSPPCKYRPARRSPDSQGGADL